MMLHIRIEDERGGTGIEKSYKMGDAMLDFRSVREYIIVQGLSINAVRVGIRVDDERGNAINTGYEFNEAINFFEKVEDKIIDDAVELSYKNREKILQKIKLI